MELGLCAALLVGRFVPEIEIVKHVEQVHLAAETQLVVDVIEIRVDRSRRDPHGCGDFLVAHALANQKCDFLLAR